jgi:lipoprotein-anchoring transpeptidase ErfK/SrfK
MSISTDPPPTREHVASAGNEAPGTIVVNTTERETDGWATRYRVAVGEGGLTMKGPATIGRKADGPRGNPLKA